MIWKVVKTGLAIYGGAVLAKKLGRYIFVKNKDKIAAWCKNKIVESCDKALDDIFHSNEKKNPVYSFHASDITFVAAENAFYAREKMIEAIHKHGRATVAELKDLCKCLYNPYDYENTIIDYEDIKWGWTDPDVFEAAPIERIKIDNSTSYKYYIDIRHPDKLGEI